MTVGRAVYQPVSASDSVPLLLERSAARCPAHTAISIGETRISYAELLQRVRSLAQGLFELGVRPGDRVALMLPNTPAYVMTSYALLRIGAVIVNVSPQSQGSELISILRQSEAVALFALDVFLPGLYKALDKSPIKYLYISSVQGLEKKLPVPPGIPLPQPLESLFRTPQESTAGPQPVADDLAVIQFTSGSTGTPKGVMLSHRNVLASVRQSALWMNAEELPNAGVLCVIPFFHVFGMSIGLHLTIAKAYRMILVPRFDALDLMPIVQLIEKERPLSFPAVPTLWAALMSHPAVTKELLSSIRVASSGGASLPEWVQQKYRALTGRPIYEAYGLSEAGGATHASPFPQGGALGSIGSPLAAVKAKLVDPESGAREVAVGEVGELLVSGEVVMRGYLGNDELTRKVLRDGWLCTGDLARCDADGQYSIVDRKDDLIITSGYNVYPSEVEAALAQHPAVQDVAVVGREDRLRGQVVIAHVVLRPGLVATTESLLLLCRDNLPDYKVPRSVVFTDRVPRNPAGKTLRKDLPAAAESAS
jgi:long-chain acyl-CoA synthetase